MQLSLNITYVQYLLLYADYFLQKNKVVVFMKGVPEEPRCGFSNAVVQILRMHGVTYEAHDVLKDEELRQGKLLQVFTIVHQVYLVFTFI